MADFVVPLLAASVAGADPLSHHLDFDDPIPVDRDHGRWRARISEINHFSASPDFAGAFARVNRLQISLRGAE
jgi:hypothetical protein